VERTGRRLLRGPLAAVFCQSGQGDPTGDQPETIDWKAVAETWSHSSARYPSQPRGDAYALASQVADIPVGALSMIAEPKGVKESGTVWVSTTFPNQNLNQSAKTVRASLTAPAGYAVRPVTTTGTWWQGDLGGVTDVSSVNVRNYVDGTRFYTYQLLESVDGTNYFVLGGKSNNDPADDAGDTFRASANACYIRIVGLSNSANSSFHLTEVAVRSPAG
jgi:hypothetical protein